MPATTRRPCVKCLKNRAERFFKSPRGRVCVTCQRTRTRATNRVRHVSTTYGLTAEEYAALVAAQGGKCPICGGERKRFDLDHCHKTGLIRGLPCPRCNRKLLTAAMNNPAILRAAADYLENPPALAVIGERLVPDEFKDGGPSRRSRTRRRRHPLAQAERVEQEPA